MNNVNFDFSPKATLNTVLVYLFLTLWLQIFCTHFMEDVLDIRKLFSETSSTR